MQPPKTAIGATRINSPSNVLSRRFSATVAIAGGLACAMLAGAAPAAAINPGGGRHRVQVERQHQGMRNQQRSHAASADNSTLDQELYRLRMCESHNNYRENTGNGYYGAYQFALQTWEDLGMTGRPDQATPDMQDYAAKVLHARAGWGPWPACAAKEGLN